MTVPHSISAAAKAIVLVIDDEPLLRMAATDLVEEAGMEALEAANADEAIAILESRSDIRVIITDIEMPVGSMNGLKLAEAVRRRWPPIDIIVVSGHYNAAASELPERAVFFAKPYETRALMAQLAAFTKAA